MVKGSVVKSPSAFFAPFAVYYSVFPVCSVVKSPFAVNFKIFIN